ncbi:3-oxoacyl-ACP reductase [Leptospira perolatii]|uniref:3-oxoacyl-ACP reductase n=1 Tax=Leptospira perolatii TaxID=2023191 RepID=A0A2M9ZPQ4_9LEPT|nr:SDR family oxidoreductase [Leptospira perolatii]PJZ70806.1 3-oxoacyl-ACP reductase [Leptospira perolatii]PJZ74014.1 3-oxoacyl-ACP reductase [Leptospira perolatii]
MESRRILVAGAGTGIGKALLDKFNSISEAEVIGFSRKGIRWERHSDLEAGANYYCDLLDRQKVFHFCNTLKSKWDRLDAIYFTFGDGLFGSVENLKLEDWDRHIALNLTSAFLITKELLPLCATGTLLCYLSSTAGKQGFPESTAYSASKHGIAGFAKSLREELKPQGIRVSVVYAGAIDTDIWAGRAGFNKEDMIPASDAAHFLSELLYMPSSFNLDEVLFYPPKGIL